MGLIPFDDPSWELLPWEDRGPYPAIPAPQGQTYNFVNPPSQIAAGIATEATCLTLATGLVMMRMYTKVRILKNSGWDDYTAFLAWLGLVAMTALSRKEDHYGNGRHLWNVTGYQYVTFAQLSYAVQIVYNPVIFLTKASILLLYLRVFKPVRRTSIILYITLWANFTFYLAGVFVEAFQCSPVEKAWYPLLPGHCVNQQVAQTASAAVNTFSDFVILVLPIANVWGLKLYKKGRVGMILIFGFGLFACIASIARLVLFAKKREIVNGTQDQTWNYYATGLVSTAEITCGIIVGCLPALPAFLRHVSGIKLRIMFTSHRGDTHRSTVASWVPGSSKQAVSFPRDGSMVVPSSPTGGLKKPPPYGSLSPKVPLIFDRRATNEHPWEELDELDYVAGDDQRPTVMVTKNVEPRRPPPAAR